MKTLNALLFGVVLATVATTARAHDFSVTLGGSRLYFKVTSKAARTAEVTYKGSITSKTPCEVTGVVEIPSKVRHDSLVYTVNAIAPKAFSGATELTGIVLPSTIVKIGDFAFEGCSSLASVVYPGKQPTLGEGVFFGCTSLRDITFGSDWTVLDLAAYRWSDSLVCIAIPAKVEKLQNMKKLRSLQSVSVDANNQHFSSYGGALYDKAAATLYGVPRGMQGALHVKEGTQTIGAGALIDCLDITIIDLPSTLTSMSFRETSRMKKLEAVVLRGIKAPHTAYTADGPVFLLQVASPDVKVVTSKDAKASVASRMATEAGDYYDNAALEGVPYDVGAGEMVTQKNIKAVKNFNDYE